MTTNVATITHTITLNKVVFQYKLAFGVAAWWSSLTIWLLDSEEVVTRSPSTPGLFVLQQFKHVQVLLQGTPAWKHSQYFFKHIDLRHLQPILCAITSWFWLPCLNFESKALGLRSSISLIAWLRISWWVSELQQEKQWQFTEHTLFEAKHWQYL